MLTKIDYEDTAKRVAYNTDAWLYGVMVVVISDTWGIPRYYILAIPKSDMQEHTLLCSETDETRLTAHVEGFIENIKDIVQESISS